MKDEYGFDVDDGDVVMLESLIKSPAFTALKRVLERYRGQCMSVLLTSKEPPKLFETQGRLIGINVIEKLPSILVAQHQQKLKNQEREKSLKMKTKRS